MSTHDMSLLGEMQLFSLIHFISGYVSLSGF